MAEQTKVLSDIEKEAGNSWREWPIYIVMRLKRLQAIHERLRVQGNSPSAVVRREELLKAVYDMEGLEESSAPAPPAVLAQAAGSDEEEVPYTPLSELEETIDPAIAATSPSRLTPRKTSTDDEDYVDVDYDDK